MRQLNINDFYLLGKQIDGLEKELSIKEEKPLSKITWQLFWVRNSIAKLLEEPCAMLPSSQRAARAVIERINSFIPEDLDAFFELDRSVIVAPYRFSSLSSAISAFETVLSNDMPEMSTFAVSQIGILRTDDLINGAYKQISEALRPLLLDKAKNDIVEGGKCLAFRLSTASAFHSCRAIESGIDQYYEALNGKPYKVSAGGGNNNWGAKTEALVKEGADAKVTEFLTHIRKQYRNPVTHPEVVVEEHEAVDLFITSLSAISMMLGATKTLNEKNATPLLTGLDTPLELGDTSGEAGPPE